MAQDVMWRMNHLPAVSNGHKAAAPHNRFFLLANLLHTSRLIVLYCFQVSGSKQEEELSLVQFRSAGRSC